MHLKRSTKEVKPLESLVGNKRFFIPRKYANDCDPVTGKPVVFLSVNGYRSYIPVEEMTEMTLQEFSVLKDAGIINREVLQLSNIDFDPVKPNL